MYVSMSFAHEYIFTLFWPFPKHFSAVQYCLFVVELEASCAKSICDHASDVCTPGVDSQVVCVSVLNLWYGFVGMFSEHRSLKTLDMGISKLGSHGWQLNAAAILACMCPNILSIQACVPWKFHLAELRSDAVQLPLVQEDSAYILWVESEAASCCTNWAYASRGLIKLLSAAKKTMS